MFRVDRNGRNPAVDRANVQPAEGKTYTTFISGDVPTRPVTLKVATNR